MRRVQLLLVGLMVVAAGCARDKGQPGVAPDALGLIGPAHAAEPEESLLSEKGYLWVVPGPEWSAVIATRADEWSARKGKLYLWHREEEFGGARGYYRHIPLEGPARLDGISWSPNGESLAFYEEVEGQYRLCHVRVKEYQVRHIAKNGAGATSWSPDSRYLAFVERTETGCQVRCFPKDTAMAPVFDETWETYEVFDLAAPVGQTISELHWAPDSSKLLAAACVRQPRPGMKDKISCPALFLTWPGAEESETIWEDEGLENHIPRPQWANEGNLVIFLLQHVRGGYYASGPLYAIRPDGTDLRVLWKESEVQRFELSPDGRHALLWLLQSWRDGAPEPDRMAGVNLLTGDTRLYEEKIVALDPGSRRNGVEQTIEWAEDGSWVSLIIETYPCGRDFRRVTLELP